MGPHDIASETSRSVTCACGVEFSAWSLDKAKRKHGDHFQYEIGMAKARRALEGEDR